MNVLGVSREFAKSRAMRANVVYVLACQRSLLANVTCLRANVPKACQLLIFTCKRVNKRANMACQRAKRRANFSTWCANLPKGVQIFQTLLLRNAKGNFYTLLLYEEFYIIHHIIVIHIICICIVHKNCIILHFYTSALYFLYK